MKLTDIMLDARSQGKKYFIQSSKTGKTKMTEVRQVTSGRERRVEWELTGMSHQGAFLGLEHSTCCSGGGRWCTYRKFIPLYNYGLYKTRTHWQLTTLRQMTKMLTRAKIPDTPSLGQEPSPNSTHGQPWAPRC